MSLDWGAATRLDDGSAAAPSVGVARVVSAAASHWFRAAADSRSAARLEAERWLLLRRAPCCGGAAFAPWMVVAPCVAVQACAGSIYSWSIFNAAMDSRVWNAPGTNALAFLVSVASYGLSTAALGAHIGRIGPLAAVARAAVLLPAAWACASAASAAGSLAGLLLGYGLLLGVGIAHGYLATTSVMQRWFPKRKGLAAGVAVAGFGIGAFAWTLLGKALLSDAYSYSVPGVQAAFAWTALVALLLSLPFMRLPPPGWLPPEAAAVAAAAETEKASAAAAAAVEAAAAGAAAGDAAPASPSAATFSSSAAATTPMSSAKTSTMQPAPADLPPVLVECPAVMPPPSASARSPDRVYTLALAASTLEFWLCAMLVFCSSMPGVVFLSSSADMAMYAFSLSASTGFSITAAQNAVNFAGRLGWGLFSDRTGRKSFYLFAAIAQTVAVTAMPAAVRGGALGVWLCSFLAIGSLYGGTFGVLPALTSELFGPGISSATHGCMLSFWALSAVVGVPIFTRITATHTVAAGISPSGAVVYHPSPDAYAINAEWLIALPALASLAAALLNTRTRDRILRRAGAQLRVRLPAGRVAIFDWHRDAGASAAWLRVRVLDSAQQEDEWAAHLLADAQAAEAGCKGPSSGLADLATITLSPLPAARTHTLGNN